MTGRRFIAGAVCPRCRAVDKIVVEQTGNDQRRSCVACGFQETMSRTPDQDATSASERLSVKGGRFDRPARRTDGEELQRPVRIIDPSRPDGEA